MQTTANGTVANSLPENVVILLTLLISKRYIPYANLRKKVSGICISRIFDPPLRRHNEKERFVILIGGQGKIAG